MEFASAGFGELSRALPFARILYPCQYGLWIRVASGFARFAKRLYLDPYGFIRGSYPYFAYEIYIITPNLSRP